MKFWELLRWIPSHCRIAMELWIGVDASSWMLWMCKPDSGHPWMEACPRMNHNVASETSDAITPSWSSPELWWLHSCLQLASVTLFTDFCKFLTFPLGQRSHLDFRENRALSKTSWRIFRDDMRVVSEEEMKSALSVGSTRTKLSNMAKFSKHHAIIGTNTHASFHLYPQRRSIVFNREDMQMLTAVSSLNTKTKIPSTVLTRIKKRWFWINWFLIHLITFIAN